MKNKQKNTFYRDSYLTLATWVVLIGAWFLFTELRVIDSVLLPSPTKVWQTFVQILNGGYAGYSLWQHLGTSFYRLFIALILAIVIAVPLGLLSGTSSKVRAVVDSIVHFYRPLPPLAYYTLLILWLGIDDTSKVMLLFLAALAPIYIACVAAVGEVPDDYVYQAKSLGASKRQIFFRVTLPASLPQIFIGIRTAVGVAYTTLVASEMVAATNGIGWMVIDASKYLRSDVMFVGIILMGLTGIMLDLGLRTLQQRYVFWSSGSVKSSNKVRSLRFKQVFSFLFAVFIVVMMVLSRFQSSQAHDQKIRVGLLRVPNDEMVAKATGIIDREFAKRKVSVEYIAFDSGVDANKAFSSNSIDFATMGHTNGLVALSTGLDVELIWIHEILGDVEALVARNGSGIESIADLAGKKIATTFASTSHYSLLSTLRKAGIEQKVTLLDMQTPDIVAAWQRGDIDAAYTWQPSLGEIMKDGKVLISSREVAEQGNITANILMARKGFSKENPDLVITFLSCLAQAGDIYRETPDKAAESLTDELMISKEELLFQMSGSRWLTPEEEISKPILGRETASGDFIQTLKDTADFLGAERYIGRIPTYEEIAEYVNTILHRKVGGRMEMIRRDLTNKKRIMAIEKVSHTYPALSRASSKIEALRDISLELFECEFVCMLGPSGCGKSTLLHLLAGYMTPTDGRIMMRDREVTSPDISRGVVFQQPSLYPWLTCGENVLFGPRMRGIASEQLEEIRDTYLSKVNLLEFKNTLPQELSGGMRQRVALARSIANEPDVLLLDEPLGALDALTRIQTQHLLRELWVDSCKTIFMITHDIDEALSLATRIVVMSNRPGTILKEFQTDFTLTAFDNESNRVTITPEYVSLRDEIFDLIVKK